MKTRRRRSKWLALGFAGVLAGLTLKGRARPYRRALARRPATAFITGASSGIGAEFARQLAAQGYDLVLTARRAERLQDLAAELEQRYSITAQALVADLDDPADVERVAARIRESNALALLVNNAGFGVPRNFTRGDLKDQTDMIQVHVVATVRLTHAALARMIERHHGAIINVSSAAALVPIAGHPTYAGTKAFLNAFSEALAAELQGKGVHIQALCPGFTRTEFHSTTRYSWSRSNIPGWMWLSARDVVADSLAALERGEVICVPDLRYKLVALAAHSGLVSFSWRFIGTWFRRRSS